MGDKQNIEEWKNAGRGIWRGMQKVGGGVKDAANYVEGTTPTPAENMRRFVESNGGTTNRPLDPATIAALQAAAAGHGASGSWGDSPPQQAAATAAAGGQPPPDPAPPTQQTITNLAAATPPASPFDGTTPPTAPPRDSSGGRGIGGGGNDRAITDLLGQIGSSGLQSVNDQKKNVTDQEQMLKAYLSSMSPQTDISSLAALADTWYGGHSAQSYAKPISGKDIVGNQMQLQGALQKARTGVSEADLNLLKDQLSGRLKLKELGDRTVDNDLKRAQAKLTNLQSDSLKNEKVDIAAREAFNNFAASNNLSQVNNLADGALRVKGLLGGKTELPVNDQVLMGAMADVMTAYNEGVAKLGALAVDDKSILQVGTQTATDLKGMLFKRLSGVTPADVNTSMDRLIKTTDQIMDAVDKKQKATWGGRTDNLMSTYRKDYEARKNLGAGKAPTATPMLDYTKMTDAEIDAAHTKEFGAHH